jgi:hypothetical protein
MLRCGAFAVVAVTSLLATQLAAAEPEAGKFYRIVNVHSHKCLALGDGGAKADESQVVQRNPGQLERQQWSLEALPGGKHYRIINRMNGQALSVDSTEANAPVFASTSAKGRQWSLEKKGENYLIRSRHSDLVMNVVDESTDRKAPIVQAQPNDQPNQLFRFEEIAN